MKPFVIKNEEQYKTALDHVATLMNASPGSPEEAELEVWGALIELYEKDAHPIPLPDPVEAIKFRMEQANLSRKAMVPYLGNISKVSEVLSGKRPLSLAMMRRLHEGLGIPAAVLLRESGAELPSADATVDWSQFPVAEMIKRGWIAYKGNSRGIGERSEELIRRFMEPFEPDVAQHLCTRQHVRDGRKMDAYALCAWKIRIMHLAAKQEVAAYVRGTVTLDFIREIVRLSRLDESPRLAREYLAKSGIHLVTEPHLSGTYLDGAALLMPDGHPLVALTLRYDRLDNFWFTLAHELAHVAMHLEGEERVFFDDLEAGGSSQLETEADRMASDALIPQTAWQSARLTTDSTPDQIQAFAVGLRISPAIPAGRIRFEAKNHRLFWPLLGKGQVRRLFGRRIGTGFSYGLCSLNRFISK